MSICERDTSAVGLAVRTSTAGQPPRIVGYAAVFDTPSAVLVEAGRTFREIVARGAFTKTIKDGADVRALVNHDPAYVLGRTTSGTLTLKEDAKGLWYEVTPPDTQWARDLMATLRRGDINQSSFAFSVVKDEWRKSRTADGQPIDERTILDAQLFDVSPVTYPAYLSTSAGLRSLRPTPRADLAALVRHEHLAAAWQPSPVPTPTRGLPLSPRTRLMQHENFALREWAKSRQPRRPAGAIETQPPRYTFIVTR